MLEGYVHPCPYADSVARPAEPPDNAGPSIEIHQEQDVRDPVCNDGMNRVTDHGIAMNQTAACPFPVVHDGLAVLAEVTRRVPGPPALVATLDQKALFACTIPENAAQVVQLKDHTEPFANSCHRANRSDASRDVTNTGAASASWLAANPRTCWTASTTVFIPWI